MNSQTKVSNNEDWEYLVSFLPEGWEQCAADTGAMLRCRGFSTASDLLRTLLIHLMEGSSLRETVVRAKELGIADVSDVALLKRLKASGEWFRSMTKGLMERTVSQEAWNVLPESYAVRLVDATCVSRPGSKSTDWRIHYSMELPSLRCMDLIVSDAQGGETLRNFKAGPKQLFIGDRGYSNRPGVKHIVDQGGDVLVRMNLDTLPLLVADGRGEFRLLQRLRRLSARQIGEWAVSVDCDGHRVLGRVCAVKKSREAAYIAEKKIMETAARKQKTVKEETLEAAHYVFVFTTLSSAIMSAKDALEVYRGRWQIELAFKRFKSLLELGNLPKQEHVGALSWIYGKMFVALLIETIMTNAERFFPWGYPLAASNET